MSNKKLWLGAGVLGCFGMVMVGGFVVVGMVALFLLSSSPAPAAPVRPPEGQGYAPDHGGEPAPQPASRTVVLTGRVVDDYTSEGIPGAYFILLTPGTTFEQFVNASDSRKQTLIQAGVRTDGSGTFQIRDFPRGYRHTVMVAADGYQLLYDDNEEIVASDSPDVTDLGSVGLSRQ